MSTLPDNVILVEGRHEEKQEQGVEGKESKYEILQSLRHTLTSKVLDIFLISSCPQKFSPPAVLTEVFSAYWM